MPDCDEVYTKFDIQTISKAIENGLEQAEYNFVFSHDEFGNAAVEFMHSKAYDRRKLKWVGIIHEVLSGEAKRQYFPPEIIKLEHWQNHKTNRSGYLRGLALDCFENKQNDRNSHYFARELLGNGRYNSAIKEFERHIAMNGWQVERSQSMIFVGDCYMKLGNETEGIKWWHKAFDTEAKRREPLMRLAEYYWKKNDPQHCVAYAEAALTIPQDGFYANNASHYRHAPHEILYWAYWYLGDKQKAKAHFDKAFEYQPNSYKFLRERIFFYDT
jgi:tetratricopeptide (TPR) repeat protein